MYEHSNSDLMISKQTPMFIPKNVKLSNASKELEQIIQRLEVGTILTHFYRKGCKIERKYFSIHLDTRQLVWYSLTNEGNKPSSIIRGIIDLREIKEVRIGPAKAFDYQNNNEIVLPQSPADVNFISGFNFNAIPLRKWEKWERNQCFVIYYGSTFNLKTLTCAGKFFLKKTTTINKFYFDSIFRQRM